MKRPWIGIALIVTLVSSIVGAATIVVPQAGALSQSPSDSAKVADKREENSGKTQQIQAGEVPAGLSAGDWGSIQAQIAAGPYRAYVGEGGYRSANPAHGWNIQYGADGATTLSPRDKRAAQWRWAMTLTGYGYEDLLPLSQPHGVQAAGQRLTYQWGGGVSEWWVNGRDGLEQGFTLLQRPARRGTTSDTAAPLRLRLGIGGDLRAVQEGNALSFVDASGAAAFTYGKLRAWDARGRDVAVRMTLGEDSQMDQQALTLAVDDVNAVYPLTIDPLLQQAYLKASNTGAGDWFGQSVAISGDTVVVGAVGEDSNATGVNGSCQADETKRRQSLVKSDVRMSPGISVGLLIHTSAGGPAKIGI